MRGEPGGTCEVSLEEFPASAIGEAARCRNQGSHPRLRKLKAVFAHGWMRVRQRAFNLLIGQSCLSLGSATNLEPVERPQGMDACFGGLAVGAKRLQVGQCL